MALAADDLLPRVVAALFGRRRLDRLAVDDPRRRARRAARPFAVDHERNIMDGSEQKHPDEATEPPIDCLPGREILRQHSPASAGAGHIADRVQYLTQINLGLAAPPGRLRQERRDPLPFLVRQIGRIPLRFFRNVGHPATIRWGPHPKLESRRKPQHNQFSNGLLGQALGTDYSDAFYVLDPAPTHIGYWDLAFSTSPLTGNISQEASNFIVGAIPAFNPSSIYSFDLNTGSSVPTHLFFGVDDDILTDNTGAYVLVVTQLDPAVVAPAVPEPSTWAMLLLGFAGVGFMAYRRKSKPVLNSV